MSDIVQLILHDAQEAHLKRLECDKLSPLHQSFLAWLLPLRFGSDGLDEAIRSACKKQGGSRSYRDVALLGFCSSRVVALGLTESSCKLVEWLAGTKVRTSDGYDPIVDDPIGLLGVRQSIFECGEEVQRRGKTWLKSVCQESVSGTAKVSHVAAFRGVEHGLGEPQNLALLSADVIVALQSKGLLKVDSKFYAQAFEKAKTPAEDGDIFVCAVRLAALDWLQSQTALNINAPDVEQVIRILEGVQASLYRWVWEEKARTGRRNASPRKWHIENEYHFQSLLYAVLRPIFPDLKEEEYTASVGSTQPRTDLYIPSLKLVIEVKFWYRQDNSRKLLNELAADASLYRAKRSEVQSVVPIIWDDGMRTQEHPIVQDGVLAIDGLSRAVFVNRPSTWAAN